jgi:hypothetical protein
VIDHMFQASEHVVAPDSTCRPFVVLHDWVASMDPNTIQLIGLFLGPVLALVPIVVWEFWFRPRRERIQAAGTIARELVFDRGLLSDSEDIDLPEMPIALATHTSMSREAFDSVALSLPHLPAGVVANLHLLYNQLDRFNAFAREHDGLLATMALSELSEAMKQKYLKRLAMIVDGVRTQRRLCLNKIEVSLNDLRPHCAREDRVLCGPPRPKVPLFTKAVPPKKTEG